MTHLEALEAAEAVRAKNTRLLITYYAMGAEYLLMVQEPQSGNIPPPSIGRLVYQGDAFDSEGTPRIGRPQP